MAAQIVKSLSILPMFADMPKAVNGIRTVIFTTALSTMASSSSNVSAEFSVTAIDPKSPLSTAWIEAPDSVPLENIMAHGRLSATTESASPVNRKHAAAVA